MTTCSIPDAVQELMRELMPTPRSPRYRYWTGPRGEMYCYSTESIHGKFSTWTYQPAGKGARSGKPEHWHLIDRVDFSRRKVAKARAYARYLKSKEAK